MIQKKEIKEKFEKEIDLNPHLKRKQKNFQQIINASSIES